MTKATETTAMTAAPRRAESGLRRLRRVAVSLTVLGLGLSLAGGVLPAGASARLAARASAPALAPAALAPDTYTPSAGTRFVHWNEPSTRSYVKNHVLRAVDSTPSGGRIRWIVYSFGDRSFADALIRARNRGVTVQIIANSHNYDAWPEWRRLRSALGVSLTRGSRPPSRVSWARMCRAACRGAGSGHVHSKVLLFSEAGSAKTVTMYGSWNPTTVANERQWNHWNTTWDKDTYLRYLTIFQQATKDQRYPYTTFQTGGLTSWVFPKPGTTARTDPMTTVFTNIHCTGLTGNAGYHGRTNIKIGMYAWYGNRGDWLARKVREKWNQGCYVSVIGAVMSASAKHILLSSTGRGRIPVKLAITYRGGQPWQYYHDKFVAVSGAFGASTNYNAVWAGSTNFSDIGFLADDMTIRQVSRANLLAYFRDFNHVWGGRNISNARMAPARTVDGRVAPPSNQLPAELGKGVLSTLEAD